MENVILAVIALALGAIGYAVGRATARRGGLEEGRAEGAQRLRALLDAVERGRAPEGSSAGSPEAELFAVLERRWAPRDAERQTALREAIGRVSGFLAKNVRTPLEGAAPDAGQEELRERVDRALGALQDLDFFMSVPTDAPEARDLSKLAQQVAREFAADQDVGVRLLFDGSRVSASVSAVSLMDAMYLVLHNAARFGGRHTIDLRVKAEDGRARVIVRDRGEGFSEEAFGRAFDPFYSTSDEGLGLGLPHARRVVEGMGGRIELRNVPDGGAEVEISFPSA